MGTSGFTSGIFYDTGIVTAITNSVMLGIVVALIATALVTLPGLAFRYKFKGRDFAVYLLLGFVIPTIVMGLGGERAIFCSLGSGDIWDPTPHQDDIAAKRWLGDSSVCK